MRYLHTVRRLEEVRNLRAQSLPFPFLARLLRPSQCCSRVFDNLISRSDNLIKFPLSLLPLLNSYLLNCGTRYNYNRSSVGPYLCLHLTTELLSNKCCIIMASMNFSLFTDCFCMRWSSHLPCPLVICLGHRRNYYFQLANQLVESDVSSSWTNARWR